MTYQLILKGKKNSLEKCINYVLVFVCHAFEADVLRLKIY